MAFPPRRAGNTHQPVRCQGSQRRASEGCPSFTPAAHRGQTQEGRRIRLTRQASSMPVRRRSGRSTGDRHARHEVTDVVDPVPGVDEPGQDVARGAEACVEDRGVDEALLDQEHALALGQVERDARVSPFPRSTRPLVEQYSDRLSPGAHEADPVGSTREVGAGSFFELSSSSGVCPLSWPPSSPPAGETSQAPR